LLHSDHGDDDDWYCKYREWAWHDGNRLARQQAEELSALPSQTLRRAEPWQAAAAAVFSGHALGAV
jgi:hypothetical protein